MFCKKGVLRNVAKLTGKHPYQSLFLIKLQTWGKNKKALAQAFSCEFCKISKNPFFTEHLRATASESTKVWKLLPIYDERERSISNKKRKLKKWNAAEYNAGNISMQVITSYWIKDRKLTEIFIFALVCGASKVQKKIFYFSTTFWKHRRGRVKKSLLCMVHCRLVFSRFFDIRGNLGNAKKTLLFTDWRNTTILV